MSDDNGRISVSRDALRAELATMELRLVEKLATQSEVEVLRRDVDSLRRWRSYAAGVSTAALGVGTTALGVALRFLA